MPLSAGERLGPHEILALIGAGGMGEVCRAHDTRLNRDVAIKVSHVEFSERFASEARSIAALNHPNICTLYDVGPNYLVMEYIEGEAPKGPCRSMMRRDSRARSPTRSKDGRFLIPTQVEQSATAPVPSWSTGTRRSRNNPVYNHQDVKH
jgi:serine/threonine protein kinase